MRYIKFGELQDERILSSLEIAKREYENGELIEVRDRLIEIIGAIDDFTELEGQL